MYGVNPYLPLEITPIPKGSLIHANAKERLEDFLKLHHQVKNQIEKMNHKYMTRANKWRTQSSF